MSWGTRDFEPSQGGYRTPDAAPGSGGILASLNRLLFVLFHTPAALFARLYVGGVFFASGQTKVEGTTIGGKVGPFLEGKIREMDLSVIIPTKIKDSAFFLFREEYKLPFIPSDIAAVLGTAAEHVLPILLVLGLFTRFSALGLFVMTMVIQFLVYPTAWWSAHVIWAVMLGYLIATGAGAISLDRLLFGKR